MTVLNTCQLILTILDNFSIAKLKERQIITEIRMDLYLKCPLARPSFKDLWLVFLWVTGEERNKKPKEEGSSFWVLPVFGEG